MEETYQNIHMKKEDEEVNNSKWDMIQEGEDSESSSTTDHSSMASSSCLSTDDNEVLEDASSSSSSSANGPLFHLTDLMNQLPTMRRGLSKHYKGKSQSFTSLAHVKNLEDLAKKVSPYGTISSSYDRISSRRRMMKSCKSYAVFAEATIT